MAGGQERILRRRIKSIQSTKKITKAMELIAASQIVRAQGRIAAAKPYQEGMARIVLETALGDPDAAGRLLGTPETIDQGGRAVAWWPTGACAAATTPRCFRATERLLAEGTRPTASSTGCSRWARRPRATSGSAGQPVERSFIGISERPTFTDAREVAAAVLTPFVDGEVDQVLIVSTRFLSAGSQKVEVRQLLPLVDPREASRPTGARRPAADVAPTRDPLGYTEFEPDAAILLETWPRGRPRPRSSPPCSRPRPPRSPPASGPWPRPPRTPAS